MNLSVMKDYSENIRYNNPNIPIYVKLGNLISFQNMESMCHWHEDIELLMPVTGHISYNVNGDNFIINSGSAIMVNSKQMHYGYSSDGSDCKYICIAFHSSLLFSNVELQKKYVTPILESNFSQFIFNNSNPIHKPLFRLIKKIYSLYSDNKDGYELLAYSYLYKFWNQMYSLLKSTITDASPCNDSDLITLKNMLSYLYEHYQCKISLAELSHVGGVCRSRCCQIFKKYLNHTPNEYLNSYRLEKSMELLHDNSISITEIAYSSGFSSPSYFAETFYKYKGCTPSIYRQQLQYSSHSLSHIDFR